MKICLVTLHALTNHGGVLQAYATQNILENFGEVKILDYRNKFVNKHMQLIRFGMQPRDALRIAQDLCRLYSRSRSIKKFKEFINSRMNLHAFNDCQLGDLVDVFDVFIAGGDQIWNPKILGEKNEFDDIYLLNFVKDKRKVSYASSIGSYEVSNGDKLISALSSFNYLSLREDDSANSISKILDREVSHVLDPTLLYDKKDWISMLNLSNSNTNKNKYIFLYALERDKIFVEAVNSFSEKLGIDVIIVDQDPFIGFNVTRHYKSASPKLFLSLLLNAELIITNSFHGTAFSVNFEKSFYTIIPPRSTNRVISFLSSVGLSDRLISNKNQLNKIYHDQQQDFTEARQKLAKLRNLSLEYLNRALK